MAKSFFQKIGLVTTEEEEQKPVAKSTTAPINPLSSQIFAQPPGIPNINSSKQFVSPSPIVNPNLASIPDDSSATTVSSSTDILESAEKYFQDLFDKNGDIKPDGKPNYHDFVAAFLSLKDAPMDEHNKLISLFAGFKAQGVDLQKLIDSATNFKNIFTDKFNAFNTALETKSNSLIALDEKSIQSLADENTKIDSQIDSLTKKKIENETKIANYTKEISDTNISLNTKKSAFEGVYTRRIQEIDSNISKFKTHLI